MLQFGFQTFLDKMDFQEIKTFQQLFSHNVAKKRLKLFELFFPLFENFMCSAKTDVLLRFFY